MFLVQRYEKHDNKMKVSDRQMNTWTSWACNTAKGQRGMVDDLWWMTSVYCVML